MSSEDEDMDSEYRPDTPEETVSKATEHQILPSLSLNKYNHTYDLFQKWNKLHGAKPVTEDVLMKYFLELKKKNKPTSLWAYYSMLKATFRSNNDLDIGTYTKLLDFLKKNNAGYKPKQSPIFTEQQIEKFLNEAPDEQYLDVKVVCIFAVSGTHKSIKLVNVMVEHVKQYDDLLLVEIPKRGTSPKSSFTLTGTYFNIVQKYAALRPANMNINRFFLHYNDEKCKMLPIGRNKFFGMARKIAKYLKLPRPERYSTSSFRIKSASIGANTNVWNSTSVGEDSTEHLLDFETGLLKTSSVSHSVPSASAVSNNNQNGNNAANFTGHSTGYTSGYTTRSTAGNTTNNTTNNTSGNATGHVCTITCYEVKCAMEENVCGALHAFTILKPSDYAIVEVAAVTFASDPICRWIVAYTHNTEPVSSFNADETFKDITRTTPVNVTVVQKYIRSNSYQLLAAYVVVYGVNCRCHKESSDIFSFSVNEIKYET